jgi:hypothetical protein
MGRSFLLENHDHDDEDERSGFLPIEPIQVRRSTT